MGRGDENRTRGGCSTLDPAARRGRARPRNDAAFRDLASRLQLDDLEEALAAVLRRGWPDVSAIVRIGTEPRAVRVAGPKGVRRRAGIQDALTRPIGGAEDALGVIGYVEDDALEPRRAAARRRLAELARLAAIPARNALAYAAALQLAYRDPLTGLYNRRAALEILEREARAALRHRRPLALVLLDLDHLKGINDAHGHAAGDAALRVLAGVLQAGVRRADVVARLGGDEFVILCPDTPCDAARRVGQRIAQALAEAEFVVDGRALADGLSVSWGAVDLADAAAYAASGANAAPGSAATEPATRMVELADRELYRAKLSRRPAVPEQPPLSLHA